MRSGIFNTIRAVALVLVGTAMVALPGSALAAEAPIKQVVSAHIGLEVDATTKGDICTVESKDQCQFGAQSSEAGAFRYAEGVAVNDATALVSPEHGDVYVADTGNQRVQVFSPSGVFVSMFGWDVDRTKTEEGAPQSERNVCTAASKDVCQAGVAGAAAGQFSSPTSVVVDPTTGNVYVQDFFNWRVQEITATGAFILMIGKEVNETKDGTSAAAAEKNLCTAESKNICKAGERAVENSTEPAAFDFEQNRGELLAVNPEGLLYVGDKHRVQRFNSGGAPAAGEISLASISSEPNSAVRAVAVDPAGYVYVAYDVKNLANAIYEFGPSGELLNRFELSPRRPEAVAVDVIIGAIALDPAGRLAVTEVERGFVEGADFVARRGALYMVQGSGLRLFTEFINEFPAEFEISSAKALSFNDEGDMYAVGGHEVISYRPMRVGALSGKPAVCKPGLDSETDATFDCELKGEANPWGVSGTEVWFQWGKTPILGLETESQKIKPEETPVQVSAPLTGLLPNETYYYRLAGTDQNIHPPELLAGERILLATPASAPRIVVEPSVLHVGPFSAVMAGELNPENANTTYEFQYGVCEDLESCPGLLETEQAQSPTYGVVGTTMEARGLLSNTLYHYRLRTKNQGGEATSQTGTFTTAPGPVVSAQTGAASGVATSSAIISGTVNPDGQAASYTFELGRYNGSETRFGVVFSAPTGSGAVPVEESLSLSGLQPGTTYAYRITIHSGAGGGKGQSATGATLTFTTGGLPTVLIVPAPLPMLTVPPFPFPNQPKTCKRGYKRDRHGRCVKSKRKKRGKKTGQSKR
jgi:hypothetical protein